MASQSNVELSAKRPMTDKDKLDLYVDLFKFYLELILKVSVFAAAVVGGIMAFAVSNRNGASPSARIGFFMVPAGLSFAIGLMSWRHIENAREMYDEIIRLGRSLDLTPPPHVHLLVDATFVCSIAYFALTGGVLIVALLTILGM